MLIRGWKQPAERTGIALFGATSPHFRGPVFEAITDCGVQSRIRQTRPVSPHTQKVRRVGCIRRNYQYLAAGLLETLAVIAPQAQVILTGDPYEKIQSETYCRFLVAMNNDSALKTLKNTIIGEIGGSSLRITDGNDYLLDQRCRNGICHRTPHHNHAGLKKCAR